VGIIFKKGKLHKKVAEEELLAAFLAELDLLVEEKRRQIGSPVSQIAD